MDYSAYLNLHQFNDEARKELQDFIDNLFVKYKIKKDKVKIPRKRVKRFTALSINTKGYKFNRDEANER